MQNSAQEQQKTFFIVDDHAAVREATVAALKGKHPNAKIITAQTAAEAHQKLKQIKPDVIIVDLSIPEASGEVSQTETGLNLLQQLLDAYPSYNFVVQSANTPALIRIKPIIDDHQGGFTVVDKAESMEKMTMSIDWALNGVFSTPKAIRGNVIEIKPEWLTVMTLAFQESMTDKAIAQKMSVAERTVRAYWTKLQDALEVYPAEGINLRTQTQNKAREKGLID